MSNQVIPKTRILFFLLCFISGFSWSQSLAYRTLLSGLYDGDFPTIKPEQVTKISDYQILDAREKGEFEVSHIQGAKWVGYDTFSLRNVASLDKTRPVIIYCTVGARSQEIGKKLQQEGFAQVYNLYGGIIHWVNEGKPVVSNGKPTPKVHTYSKTWGIWLEKGERVY